MEYFYFQENLASSCGTTDYTDANSRLSFITDSETDTVIDVSLYSQDEKTRF